MSSEKIRLELESFINRGLKEGLRGWPVKREPCTVVGIHDHHICDRQQDFVAFPLYRWKKGSS